MEIQPTVYRHLPGRIPFIHLIWIFLVFLILPVSGEETAERKALYFSQHDRRWSGDLMGDSTMDIYGCLVTSLAMIISSRDREITPGVLNGYLRENHGYTGGNSVVFQSLETYPGAGLHFVSREIFTLSAMKRYLDGGYQVIAGFPGGIHWVYVLGYRGDGSLLSQYGYHDPGRAGADRLFSSSLPPASLRVFRFTETTK